MKKIVAVLMTLVLIITLVSCKGAKHEINKLAVVLAVGFDLTRDNKYLFTVQVLNTEKESSSSSMGQNKNEQQNPSDVIVYSMEGETPNDAITKLNRQLANTLFFGHTKYTVIGNDLAQAGMALFVDEALRGYDRRVDSILLVTEGRAQDIVKIVTNEDKIPANVVNGLIKNQANCGYIPVVSRMNFANALYSKTAAPTLGVIRLRENNGNKVFDLGGTAVFNKDKLVGYMDINQTRGMQWINGKVKNGNIAVSLPNNNFVDFYILTGKSKIKSKMENGELVIEIKIKEEGNIQTITMPVDPMKDYKIMDKFSEIQGDAIEKEAILALQAAQKKYKLDIFDFSGVIKRDNPEYWNKIQKNWSDVFPNLKVKIYVDAKVRRPGLISKPVI
jgi:spore germination protein KC